MAQIIDRLVEQRDNDIAAKGECSLLIVDESDLLPLFRSVGSDGRVPFQMMDYGQFLRDIRARRFKVLGLPVYIGWAER